MINKIYYFIYQKILVIVFIFCMFTICYSLLRINSNKIIFGKVNKSENINVESIIHTCKKYDMTVYYPSTKNNEINKQIKAVINSYTETLEKDTMYFIPKSNNDKFNLLIKYEIERINKDIVSFIFLIDYSKGESSSMYTYIITMTYNLNTSKKLNLNNFFEKSTNYIYTLCDISKEILLTNNNIDEKNLKWFVDDINNSFENSFDGYAFSNNYLYIYFNTNKISSKYNNIYVVKIPWVSISHLLKNNIYTNNVYDK